MTEAQKKSLKIIRREIDALKPFQKHFDTELEIIRDTVRDVHAAIVERRGPLRIWLPKWRAVEQRFARYNSEFAKFSRKVAGLRVRVDSFDKTDVPAKEIEALNDTLLALLDGSHRLKVAEKLTPPSGISL